MGSYTIADDKQLTAQIITEYYTSAKASYRSFSWRDLDVIFGVALKNRDRFPGINLSGVVSPRAYIERWVKNYVEAVNNPPSLRTATPKSACTDPAIRVIVQATQGTDVSVAEAGEKNHNLFMSAENIQGNLLEEYIASKVRPYGFLWCEGNVLRAVDFCNTDGSLFLQIKNKSNTENSSSSNIRAGTPIEKWFRLGTQIRAGVRLPKFKWTDLNRIISQHRTEGAALPNPAMSEDDYQVFLSRVAKANPHLISDL